MMIDGGKAGLSPLADLMLSSLEYYFDSSRIFALRERRIQRQRQHYQAIYPETPVAEVHVDALATGEVLGRWGGFRRPLVVRGALAGSAAVERWGYQYLTDVCGEGRYDVVVSPESRADNRDVVEQRMGFREYYERIRAGEHQLALELCSDIFLDYPQLRDDLQVDALVKRLGIDARYESTAFQLFLQPQSAYTDLHAAFGGNLFLNIRGRKKWIFIDPRYTHLLHARPKPVLDSPIKPFFHLDCIQSLAQGDAFLQHLPRSSVTLEPGDVLLNPPWWWHGVFSEGEENIAVATRISPHWYDWRLLQDPNLRNNPGYALMSVYLPVRAYLALAQLKAVVTTGEPLPSDAVLSALFRRDEA